MRDTMLQYLLLVSPLLAGGSADSSLPKPVTECQGADRCAVCPEGYTKFESSCVPCNESETAYVGSNLLSEPLETDTGTECQAQCSKRDECQFWTHATGTGACYLKFNRGGSVMKWTNYESGVKNCTVQYIESPVSSKFTATSNLPLLNIVHGRNTGRTVLQGLPATFGSAIRGRYLGVGQPELTKPMTACGPLAPPGVSENIFPKSRRKQMINFSSKIAVVERGDCKFVDKALHADEAGYKGLIILDNQSHTGFKQITGINNSIRIPVIFLLKPEADRLRKVLNSNIPLTAFMQDSSYFSPILRDLPQDVLTVPKQLDESSKYKFRPMGPTTLEDNERKWFKSILIDSNDVDGETVGIRVGGFSFSPMMVAFFVVIAVLILLAIVTVVAYVRHYMRQYRRRAERRSRCQQSVREIEAYYRNNPPPHGHSTAANSLASSTRSSRRRKPLDVHSAAKVLECPVCLEVAWPPKKIFQCMQGHIICEECRQHPQLTTCPMCRQVLNSRYMSRNLALENLALTLSQGPSSSSGKCGSTTETTNVVTVHVETGIESGNQANLYPSAPSMEDILLASEETNEEEDHHSEDGHHPTNDDIEPLTVNLPPESTTQQP